MKPEPVAEGNLHLPARMGIEIPMLKAQVHQGALKRSRLFSRLWLLACELPFAG
jgi:hypothetical protein